MKIKPKNYQSFGAHRVAKQAHNELKKKLIMFPTREEKVLIFQLFRSSQTVIQEISGAEQIYLGFKKKSYNIAIASCHETIGGLDLSCALGYITEIECEELKAKYYKVVSILLKVLDNHYKHSKKKDKILPISDFHNFKGFNDAMELSVKVYRLSNGLEENDAFYPRKFALSVLLNICESFQLYPLEKIKYLNQAYNALQKTKNAIEVMFEDGKVNSLEIDELLDIANCIQEELFRIIVEED